ncbi:copper resistance protein CopC [Pseudochelatococcus lubricantis]|uniref:copper resistance CopC family protein n=1 Tax=Pseudochelatococcus lubricantis TaxID=1538102 RepID=UPI0035ED5C31
MTIFTRTPSSRIARWVGPMTFSLASALTFSPPALAHVRTVATAPVANEAVAPAPGEVVLTFSDKVQPDLSRITVTDSTGAAVDANDTATFGGDATKLGVNLGPLAPGTYTVSWSVICIYNHKVSGSYTFQVKRQ